MRLNNHDIKKPLKLNYNIMIIVIYLAVFIQVFSILIFPTVVEAARITCDGEKPCNGTEEDDVINAWGDDAKEVIRCGLGYDTVYIDASDDGDAAADNCENVVTV